MPQCHFWINGMATRHTENLKVCVLAVTFVHLQTGNKEMFFSCSFKCLRGPTALKADVIKEVV